MGKYGDAAVLATQMMLDGRAASPLDAWRMAVQLVFPRSLSSQEKGCPKCAYLGLCEDGLVNGVESGSYTGSVDNKRYAVEAVALLRWDPELADAPELLWACVTDDSGKTHNGQMDVVIALWQADHIV
jgi:hypothetical protein